MKRADSTPLDRALLELSPAAIVVVGTQGQVSFATPAASRIFGRDLKGRAWADLAVPQCREATHGYLGALASSEPPMTMFNLGEYRHIDGRSLWLEIRGVNLARHPDVGGMVLELADATQHRLEVEELGRLAVTDALTGLGNRAHFVSQVEAALGKSPRYVAGLFDIDQFKSVNDRHGHETGNRILQAFARQIAGALPSEAAVCRMGGDEFAFVIPGELTAALRSAIEQLTSVALDSESTAPAVAAVNASIGLTQCGEGDDIDAVMNALDVALYVAKIRGRRQVVVYSAEAAQELRNYRRGAEEFGQLVKRNQQLHAEARTDALTGLANRRALAEVEPLVVGNPGSRWSSCAVLFIDVDHFGRYNKLYGDQAGDLALQAIATGLQDSARKTDLVYRKGGEEFVVVLPHTDFAVAWVVAERMRAAIRRLGIAHADGGSDKVISVLVSVAIVRPGSALGTAVAASGDEAMRSKEAGRRACVVACS